MDRRGDARSSAGPAPIPHALVNSRAGLVWSASQKPGNRNPRGVNLKFKTSTAVPLRPHPFAPGLSRRVAHTPPRRALPHPRLPHSVPRGPLPPSQTLSPGHGARAQSEYAAANIYFSETSRARGKYPAPRDNLRRLFSAKHDGIALKNFATQNVGPGFVWARCGA